MSERRFTPGPWHLDASDPERVYADDGLPPERGYRDGTDVAEVRHPADACLISAAPDLAAAAEATVAAVEAHDLGALAAAANLARAALQKAGLR